MKIIDFAKKGNIVRFYLGEWTDEYGWTNPDYRDHYYTDDNPPKKKEKYWGDDWDDTPYEHNAGSVYEQFVKGYCDIVFPFDTIVEEPADDWHYRGNSPFCKKDFIDRKAPCIIAADTVITRWLNPPTNLHEYSFMDEVYSILAASSAKCVKKFYFGDELEPTKEGEVLVWKWEGDK